MTTPAQRTPRKAMNPVKGWIVAAKGPFFHMADSSHDWHVRVYRFKEDAALQCSGTSYRPVKVSITELPAARQRRGTA
jgi:hypothetical protein